MLIFQGVYSGIPNLRLTCFPWISPRCAQVVVLSSMGLLDDSLLVGESQGMTEQRGEVKDM